MPRRLLTYALGRGLEPYGRAAVRQIATRASRNGHRFSELILGVVESDAYRKRREHLGK